MRFYVIQWLNINAGITLTSILLLSYANLKLSPWTFGTLWQEEISRQKCLNSESKSSPVKIDIWHDIMPIYHLSKICGLLPIKFVFTKSGRQSGQVDYLQVGYGIFLVLALTGSQCYGLYRDLVDGWQSSTRLSSESSITVTCGDVFAVMSVAMVAILGSPTRWQHLRRALDKLIDVDEKLGIATSESLRKLSISLIICTLIYLLVLSIFDFISAGISATTESSEVFGNKGPVNYTPMFFMYLVITGFELQYAVVLFGLGERFRKLNRAIEKITKNNVVVDCLRKNNQRRGQRVSRDPKPQITHSVLHELYHHRSNRLADECEDKDKLARAIDQLITLHATLCEGVNCLNKAYGMAILVGTISCLVHLIMTPYFLYNHLYSRNPNNWTMLVIKMFWILFHICRMLLFVQPCHMVTVKAKRTGALVNEALAINWNPEVEKQLKIFAIQLLQRPIEFTACGLFHLDRGLMTSIAGSVTTYLVILVQFQTADDTKGTKDLLENASELLKNVSNFKSIFQIK